FRIRHHAERDLHATLEEFLLDRFAYEVRRAYWDGRFIRHQSVFHHVTTYVVRRRQHVAQISRSILIRWCANCDELKLPVMYSCLDIRGKTQSTSVHIAPNYLL